MILTNLWKGIIVGLSASIPLGPIGVICIQRTLNKGRLSGFISGLGAAAADGLYACIAGFGVKIVMDSINEYQIVIRSIGGIVLLFMSYKLYVTNPGVQLRKQLQKKRKGLLGDFFSVFGLTISNPITLFVFAVVFAGFNVVDKASDLLVVILLIIGVLLGAVLWWFTLTSIVNKFRGKFKLRRMLYINRVAAILIALFAISILASIFIDKSI
ncbi:MAG TPA: LysE family transporter [Bacteroidales bacterium]|nr:LysE family transporter [Bacteroidales bacterium]HQB22674.1 LysE family transporter [Bacteroidales bacterium]